MKLITNDLYKSLIKQFEATHKQSYKDAVTHNKIAYFMQPSKINYCAYFVLTYYIVFKHAKLDSDSSK